MKKITLESIGKELNVSKVAVYKALNDQSGVSDEMRIKIKAKAEELGYRKPETHYKKNLTFTFLIKKDFFLSTGELFYTEIYYYLNEECEQIESKLQILFNDGNNRKLYQSLKESAPSGIFIIGEIEKSQYDYLTALNVPLIFIDYFSPLFKSNYVALDHYNLAYRAANYLIGKGHKQIGFVGDVHSTSAVRDRFLGYVKALIENGLPYDPRFHIDYNIEKQNDLDVELPEPMPTAFICHCDSAAHKLYMYLKVKNYLVPGDVSVISFDNTDICKTLTPPLTSIGVSKEKYAKKALESMMNLINKTMKHSNVFLNPTLTERNSVKDLSENK